MMQYIMPASAVAPSVTEKPGIALKPKPVTPGVAPFKSIIPIKGVSQLDFVVNSTVVIADGKTIPCDAPPFIANGCTMVPLRLICAAFACDVDWDEESRSITLTSWNQTLIFVMESKNYTQIFVGRQPLVKTMDVAPMICNYRTYVPIRYIGEAFGYDVSYITNEQGPVETITIVRK